jgi:hypothetical protein
VSDAPDARAPRLAAQVASALYALFAVRMATLPRGGFLAHTAPDDAFYYLAIARRAGGAVWPSFDGLHLTSGVHPLWLWLLTPIASVTQAWPWAFARLAVLLSAGLSLGAAWALGAAFARAHDRRVGWWVTALVLSSLAFARHGLMAMEGSLAALLLACSLAEAWRPTLRMAWLGVLCGLTVLARLDTLPAVGLIFAVALRRVPEVSARLPASWRIEAAPVSLRAFASGAVVAGVVASLGPLWFHAVTGHFGTTSSATKLLVVGQDAAREGGRLSGAYLGRAGHALASDGARVLRGVIDGVAGGPVALAGVDHPSFVALREHRVVTLALFVALVAAAYAMSRSAPRETRQMRWMTGPLGVLAVAGVLHLGVTSALIPGQSGAWYWGVETATALVLAALVAERVFSPGRGFALMTAANALGLAMTLAAVEGASLGGRMDVRPSFSGAMVEVATALPRWVPSDARVGSFNAGTLGFAAPRTVINLDGLVNDWSFYEARRDGQVRAWARRAGVTHFADCVVRDRQDDYARALGLEADEVETVARFDGRVCEGFIWRIRWREARVTASR